MKKHLSFLMAILMVLGLLTAAVLPAFAADDSATDNATDNATDGETDALNEFTMYISDNGADTNDGLSAEKPLKSWDAMIRKMNTNVSDGYNACKIVIVGTSSASNGGSAMAADTAPKWDYPMTITGADENAVLNINGTFRLMGETLFTALKIKGAKDKVLYTDAFKTTFGKAGVENDIVCEGLVNVSIGFPSIAMVIKRDSICTINSGTYANIYGEGRWSHQLDGSVHLTINGGTFRDGKLTMGGDYGFSGHGGIFACTGDYTFEINGGTFDNQTICIGWSKQEIVIDGASATLLPGTAYEVTLVKGTDKPINLFLGKVTLDINGGTFTDCDGKIGRGSTLDPENCTAEQLQFKKGVEINLGDIAAEKKDAYKALVAEGDAAIVVEHNYDTFEPITGDDAQHNAKCDCGCNGSQKADHNFDEGTVTKPATHTEAGNTKYTCEDCGYEKNVPIAADPNNHLYDGAVWVDHNETQHKKKCTDPSCDHYEYADHTWDAGTVTTEPTHTTEGVKTYTCADCGKTKTETVAKTEGHTMSDWTYADEKQHCRSCECGEKKYGDHTWDAGKVTKEATETEDGVKTYTCSACGGTKTETLPKTGAATTEEPEATGGCASSLSAGLALCMTVALVGACGFKKFGRS